MNCEDRLTETIRDIRARLGRAEYGDEAKVSQGIVTRLLSDLGWPIYDTTVVAREYSIQGRRVDYALFGRFSTPTVLLEVKRVGRIEVGEKQLFEYAFHGGTPILVLSDGREWWLYLTTGEGNYPDRRFAEANLSKDAPEKNAAILCRYLTREAVGSGEAKRRAEEALEARRNRRAAEDALPVVWRRMVNEACGRLAQLLGARVEEHCGTSPSEEAVTRFLGNLRVDGCQIPPPSPPPPGPDPGSGAGPHTIVLHGEVHRFGSQRDAFVGLFRLLDKRYSGFLARASQQIGGKKRPYLSQDRHAVMGDRNWSTLPVELPGRWWLRVEFFRSSMDRIVPRAAKAAGLVLGKDLIVDLG